jgi:hypothetical protein
MRRCFADSKNAYDGVPGDDIEFALAAEAAGQTVFLNAILSRQIHAADRRIGNA